MDLLLTPGATTANTLSSKGAQPSNKGRIISLLDANGLKVDGVSYTRAQKSRQGWTVKFCKTFSNNRIPWVDNNLYNVEFLCFCYPINIA